MKTPSLMRRAMFQQRGISSKVNGQTSNVHRILLTGGPCAGKTTSLAKLQTVLGDRGFSVYCVPEAATLMMKGGAVLDTSKRSWDFQVQMQTSLLKTQIHLEDIFTEIANNESKELGKPAVVLCDRGVLDGSAYVSEEVW
jgi:predicted ATPase